MPSGGVVTWKRIKYDARYVCTRAQNNIILYLLYFELGHLAIDLFNSLERISPCLLSQGKFLHFQLDETPIDFVDYLRLARYLRNCGHQR